MKKLVSFVLAALLLLSAIAFASNETTDTSLTVLGQTYTYKNPNYTNDTTATVKTNIYIQVGASGQIDVTVPLNLLFKTDVDGGKASNPTNYKIKNNGKNAVEIVKIAVVNDSGNAALQLLSFDTVVDVTDTYGVTLKAGSYDTVDMFDCTTGKTLTDAQQWKIARATSTSTELVVEPTMVTGPISYITGENTEGKGVHVMTITYTIALDFDKTKSTVDVESTTTVDTSNVG